ncbi:hypothetical protein K437DRAFT_293659 [Tilletiaria anomala UBC 951]|uniref:Ubiquitin-like domain-containing protein n=1 Tax=Tilletiaria anomala (strain ATCC 24038 / CBS 436.72 / UBC 951) TaxID=1037660 RepID=A0A066W889_TILAU|nr:uncharacterized protein K437DRAFT_293659 [Tilletiaria anomala UBC 951]KDN49936.1 hypothetical protein K437DRAFT_293659 [Tilletiaria anomala UBC 951]
MGDTRSSTRPNDSTSMSPWYATSSSGPVVDMRSKGHSVHMNSGTSNGHNPSHASSSSARITKAEKLKAKSLDNDNDDDDDETDFFDRRRKKSQPGPLIIDEDDIQKASRIEEAHIESDAESIASSISYDSDGNERRRRKRKRKNGIQDRRINGMPNWMFNPVESDEDVGKDDSDLDGVIQVIDSDEEYETTEANRRKRLERSPELTPPPEISEITRNKTRSIVQAQFKNLTSRAKPDGDSPAPLPSTALPRRDDLLTLDPDLAKLYRGADAKEVRARALAAEAARQNAQAKLNQMEADQENAVRKAKAPPSKKGSNDGEEYANDDTEVIDVNEASDNDSVTWQPDLLAKSPSKPPRASMRTPGKADAANAIEIDDDDDDSEGDDASARADAAAAEDDADDEDRLELSLKGPKGVEMNAKVKPTTLLLKVRDHFVNTKKSEIPADKLQVIKLRFDGENLNLNKSVEEAEIEDGDMIEVAW